MSMSTKVKAWLQSALGNDPAYPILHKTHVKGVYIAATNGASMHVANAPLDAKETDKLNWPRPIKDVDRAAGVYIGVDVELLKKAISLMEGDCVIHITGPETPLEISGVIDEEDCYASIMPKAINPLVLWYPDLKRS